MKPHARINRGQMGLLRLAASQVGMDWQDLKARAGVTSSKEITNAICDELMEHLKGCGFIYVPRVKKAPALQRQQRAKQIYLEAIQATLGALKKDWPYADGIAKQMFRVDKAKWCSPEQLHKVQQALIYQERRLAGDPPQPRAETLAKRRASRKDAKAQSLEEING